MSLIFCEMTLTMTLTGRPAAATIIDRFMPLVRGGGNASDREAPVASQRISMNSSLFAYVGPETLVPAASIIAAVVGGLLAFGRVIFGYFRRAIAYVLRK